VKHTGLASLTKERSHKGGATEWMIERGTGLLLFVVYILFGKPAVVREGLLAGILYFIFGSQQSSVRGCWQVIC